MLSDVDVSTYISEKLGITDWQQKLSQSKLSFLKELVQAHGLRIYYQNATWGALDLSERQCPSVQDLINHNLTSSGGACFQTNYFMTILLQHLGYNAWVSHGESNAVPVRINHIITIVQLDKEEDEDEKSLWLVDVGFARPITEPINVTTLHKIPYKTKAAGYECEYRFNPEKQVYERYLYEGCPIKGKLENGLLGKVDYFFDVKPLEYDDFKKSMGIIFTDPSVCFFLNTIFLFKFVSLKSPQDFEYTVFRGRNFIRGNPDSIMETTTYNSYIEMLPVILEHFPNLDVQELQGALINYDNRRSAVDNNFRVPVKNN